MSGSGGGDFGSGADGGGSCETLAATTILNSPDPAVLEELSVGQVLSVVCRTHGTAVTVLAVTNAGQVAGALTPAILPQLVRCIGEGHSYIAIVRGISGAVCRVDIRAGSL